MPARHRCLPAVLLPAVVLPTFLLLAGAPAHAAPPVTITYEAVTATSPTGVSRLRLTPLDDGSVAVDLVVVAPNPSQHQGHVQGLASRNGIRYTLKAPNFIEGGVLDHPALCTLVIDADDSAAKVVSEHQCVGFHGAAASFVEQGHHLVRVP